MKRFLIQGWRRLSEETRLHRKKLVFFFEINKTNQHQFLSSNFLLQFSRTIQKILLFSEDFSHFSLFQPTQV